MIESIAANLRRLRLRAGLTQEKFAEEVGLESRFTQRVLRAKVDISISTLVRLAKALDVTPASLLRPAKLEAAKPGRPAAKRPKR